MATAAFLPGLAVRSILAVAAQAVSSHLARSTLLPKRRRV